MLNNRENLVGIHIHVQLKLSSVKRVQLLQHHAWLPVCAVQGTREPGSRFLLERIILSETPLN